MVNIVPISPDRHADKRWKRYTGYQFAASDALAPLVINELPRAALTLPIGFARNGDEFVPTAVLGLAPGTNHFVLPDGRWMGPYVPAIYRSYPFRLAPMADGKHVVCVDEDSVIAQGGEGEEFFDAALQPSKAVADLMLFLEGIEKARGATRHVCQILEQNGLIQPWPIAVPTPTGERQVEGLYRIDEAALNALSGDAFLNIRAAGGLLVAYCQLLSMQHLQELVRLATTGPANIRSPLPVNQAGELDLEFMNNEPFDFGPRT